MKSWLVILSLIVNVTLFSSENFQKIEDNNQLKILTPSIQNIKTEKILLNNGLRVYLVSDPDAKQSAAALGVQNGSWSDPKEYPGMAHFCEHMLFQGTSAYPDSDFMKYVADNGGMTNAYTAPDKTVYMFSVNNNSFTNIFDRFAHFFIDPLFGTTNISKELYAVDQEHSKNIENDEWRRYMISKEIGNPDHPNRKFSTGNSDTLKIIPPKTLKRWYESHYSSNIMTLVIYSNQSLETLEKFVSAKFSKVPNHNLTPMSKSLPLFLDDTKQKFIYVKPIANIQTLSIEWELDTSLIDDESKSAELIAYTLNRGQPNSLLENLKQELLAEDLNIIVEKIDHLNLQFIMEIKLTDKGILNTKKVIQRCFEALNNLKKSGIPPYLFHEMNTMAKINYEYQSREEPFIFVMNHTAKLMSEDLSSYPQKSILANGYNSENISKALEELSPTSCQYYIVASSDKTNVQADKKEKWMEAEYSIKEISPSYISSLEKPSINPDIKLPEPNPFLPSKLTIVDTNNSEGTFTFPSHLVNNDHGSIYYTKDTKYHVPEIVWQIKIIDASITKEIKTEVLKKLYIKALNEYLEPIVYSAQAAGLNGIIYPDSYSININISGYSEKASFLLEDILKAMKNLKVSKEKFNIYHSSLLKKLENVQKELPVYQAYEELQSYLIPSQYRATEQLNALQTVSYDDFTAFSKNLFVKSYVEALLSGNLTIKDSEAIWMDIQDFVGKEAYPKNEHIKKNVLLLSNNGPYVINKNITLLGNGIILALQEGSFTFEKRAAQTILSSALQEAFFTQLRSKQKTAYMAKSKDLEIERELFQIFAVQSNSHIPNDLLTRFEIFLDDYYEEIESYIPENRFENIKENLITNLETPPNNLEEMTSRLNTLAFDYDGDFQWMLKRIEGLKELSYKDFISLSKEFLSKENKRRLAVLYQGIIPKEKEFTYTPINSGDIASIGKYVND